MNLLNPIDNKTTTSYNKVLVVNALSGTMPTEFQKQHPNTEIVCAEISDDIDDVAYLRRIGFKTIRWDDIKDEKNMKFDLVIGNPPYQDGENSHFYKQFIDVAKSLSDNVSMVVPSSYFGNKSSFDNLQYYRYNGINFDNVELATSWFIWQKNYTGPCSVYVGDDVTLVEKFAVAPADDVRLFRLVNSLVLGGIDGYEVNSGNLWRKDAILDDNGVLCIWTCGKVSGDFDKTRVAETQKPLLSGFGEHKVLFTEITGHYMIGHAKYANPDHGVARGSRYITVNSEKEADNLIRYFNSKFIKALARVIKATSKHNTKTVFRMIPRIDLSRPLTDDEIYKNFNLSSDDIDYIEKLF